MFISASRRVYLLRYVTSFLLTKISLTDVSVISLLFFVSGVFLAEDIFDNNGERATIIGHNFSFSPMTRIQTFEPKIFKLKIRIEKFQILFFSILILTAMISSLSKSSSLVSVVNYSESDPNFFNEHELGIEDLATDFAKNLTKFESESDNEDSEEENFILSKTKKK
ncbi:hypothetical protein BpHYR1_033652 [Brachionus plicatilis]|uniref:Uncharacterized protein n=1 Tax=Brachionus plicatilis TaxID=10195 RepID=A0A3M7PZS7_BRAPC|nr:hypothetical protein BpHYR1_033652 [Brachionus plicatilis]